MQLHSFTRYILFLAGFACLVAALPAPEGELQEPRTNAERLARGLAPLKPDRLYDASRVRDLRPRASGSPSNPQFQVAGGPANTPPPPPRKRDNGVPGYYTVNNGQLKYTTSSSDAATFSFSDQFSTILSWTATYNDAPNNIVMGQTYTIYTVPSGSIYKIQVGTPPASGVITRIFGVGRYQGDLNPVLPPIGQQGNQQFLWVQGSDGSLFFAPDYNTAKAADSGAQIMITQTFTPGTPPSLAAATAAQSSLLVNPVRIFGRDAAGSYVGWLGVAPGNGVTWLSGYPGTFYLPNLGNGAAYQDVLLVNKGATLIGATTPGTNPSAAGVLNPAFTQQNTTASANILSFNIPSSLSGMVSLQAQGSNYGMYFSFTTQGPNYNSLFLCDNAADCAAVASDAAPICLEVVTLTGQPSVCQAWAKQQLLQKYSLAGALYMYDPLGIYSGYMQFYDLQSPTGITNQFTGPQSNATLIYLDPANNGQAVQSVYALNGQSKLFTFRATPFYKQTDGQGMLGAEQIRGASFDGITFNIPSPLAHGSLTAYPSKYVYSGTPTNTAWEFYVSGYYGFPEYFICQSVAECIQQAETRKMCTEIVPLGESPTRCVTGWVG